MLNQFRDIHSNSVLLEFIGKKGETASFLEFYLANKQMVKQVLPGFDSNKIVLWRFSTTSAQFPIPDLNLDPLV